MEPQPTERVTVDRGGSRVAVVVMGVSGSGKSTVGYALAQRLQAPFVDADALHPPTNIAKMSAGQPLGDNDRLPWLDKVGQWLAGHPGGVASCSALKRSYRDRLRTHCARLEFLHLSGSPETIGRRLAGRSGHFMPAALLRSQFDDLEPLGADEAGITVTIDAGQDVDSIIDEFFTASAARRS
jgi:gluconokinase